MLGISVVAVNKQIKTGKIPAQKNKNNDYVIEYSKLSPATRKSIEQRKKDVLRKISRDSINEKTLWTAAEALRGSVDAANYKHIVLGLIFLKYLNDAFLSQQEKIKKSETYKKLPEKTQKEYINDKINYETDGRFYIPQNAEWEHLEKHSTSPEFAEILDAAMYSIEKANKETLQDVLPKEFVNVGVDGNTLSELITIFSQIDFKNDIQKEQDTLGNVYEYFIGQFADAEGRRGGEFYTPESVVKLLVEILEPKKGSTIFDPACGSGGMFVQSSKFAKAGDKMQFYGQESNKNTYRLCKMNLAIRGLFAGNIRCGDSYNDDKFIGKKFDIGIANPPFNATWKPEMLSPDDERLKYGTPSASNANFLWIQHFIVHMEAHGRAGFVMANGSLSVSGNEGNIRERILKDDIVEIIISCPANLFFNTGIPCSLWFLSKNKGKRKNETLFIDATDMFTMISRKQAKFAPEHMKKMVKTVRKWRTDNEYEDIPGFCRSASLEEIENNNYILTPGRYVGIPEEIDDGVPFDKKIKTLNKELEEQIKREEEMSKNIRDQLGNIVSKI